MTCDPVTFRLEVRPPRTQPACLRASPSDSPVYSEAQKDISLRYCNSSALNELIDSLLNMIEYLTNHMIWFQLPDSSLCVDNEKESMNQSIHWQTNICHNLTWYSKTHEQHQINHHTVITLYSLSLPIYIPGSINTHTLHVWNHLNFNSATLSIKQGSAPVSAKDLPTHDNELTWPACVQRVTTHSPLLVQRVNSWIRWWERTKIIQWYYSGIHSSWSSSVCWYRCLCHCDCN